MGIEAEAGAVLTREQVVELADAVAASGGVASGIGTSRYGARLIVQADSREEAVARATEEFTAAAAKAGLPPGPVVRTEAVSEDEDAMIRLGSLAGYPFEGPRVLAGWTPPPSAAVYVIAYKPDPDDQAGPVRGHLRRPLRRPDRASGSRSSIPARTAGSGARDRSGRSTSAPTRCPAAAGPTGSRSPGN